ncbi:MAG: acetate--CoA ligase family protein [Ignavibacteriaceae bacterium]|nr:acetate--CoA ligase family protein [Ignavibacteriaceae bacterium]
MEDHWKNDKPIFQVVMPLPEFWNQYRKESRTKRSLFRRSEDPAVVIGNMLKFKNKPSNKNRLSPNDVQIQGLNFAKNKFLSQEEVIQISEYYNLPNVKTQLFKYDEIKNADLKFPVVLKAVGEKIIHKSDLKGVVLNIKDKVELMKTADEMIKNFKSKNIELDAFLIQPYIHTKFELLVGGFRDPSFGPMVMFGSGGKYVEYIEDTVIRSAYLTDFDIEEMINNTKIGKIIQGVRGEASADLNKIKKTIKSVAQMMLTHKDITECDLKSTCSYGG